MECQTRISAADAVQQTSVRAARAIRNIRRRVYSRLAMAAIHERSAAELSAAYSRGELSPLEVARAFLERIEAWEPRINAMYRVQRDSALEQARAAEADRKSTRLNSSHSQISYAVF